MNLHEYQAKALLTPYGVPLPAGRLALTAEAAEEAAREIGGAFWVVKAQIHAGARGKAGGVRLVRTLEDVRAAAEGLLGSRLVTEQTGAAGKKVRHVYVEQGCDIDRELYLAALVDRSLGQVALLASQAGGEDIPGRPALCSRSRSIRSRALMRPKQPDWRPTWVWTARRPRPSPNWPPRFTRPSWTRTPA
jgi:succinyl-CoA synthetase beta subunit